jgi:hypothetical protein
LPQITPIPFGPELRFWVIELYRRVDLLGAKNAHDEHYAEYNERHSPNAREPVRGVTVPAQSQAKSFDEQAHADTTEAEQAGAKLLIPVHVH